MYLWWQLPYSPHIGQRKHSLQVHHSAEVKAKPKLCAETTEKPISLRVSIMEQSLTMEYYQDITVISGNIIMFLRVFIKITNMSTIGKVSLTLITFYLFFLNKQLVCLLPLPDFQIDVHNLGPVAIKSMISTLSLNLKDTSRLLPNLSYHTAHLAPMAPVTTGSLYPVLLHDWYWPHSVPCLTLSWLLWPLVLVILVASVSGHGKDMCFLGRKTRKNSLQKRPIFSELFSFFMQKFRLVPWSTVMTLQLKMAGISKKS